MCHSAALQTSAGDTQHPAHPASATTNSGACCRYSEAAAAAARIKELKAAEAERLKVLLTSAHQAEMVQLQDNFQQVCL
jgi:hypothetical protein